MLLLLSGPDPTTATTGRSRILPRREQQRQALIAQLEQDDEDVALIVGVLHHVLRI